MNNQVADALSRISHSAELFGFSIPMPHMFDNLPTQLLEDNYTAGIIASLQDDPLSVPHYAFASGKLYYKDRLVIPPSSKDQFSLLAEAHSSLVGGHGGVLKTLRRLQQNFFWPRMKQEVEKWVAQCSTCQRNKYSPQAPAGLLHPLPIPKRFGKTSPWISLWGCQNHMELILS